MTRFRRSARAAVILAGVYATLAYLVAPFFWRHYEHLPAMKDLPKVTRSPMGLSADPLNIALVGSEGDVQRAFAAAQWFPATPITWRSALGIVAGVALHRPDPEAPVSDLFLFDRHQDLAFQRDVGGSPRERHHVRFWKTTLTAEGGRTVWVGAATFDRSVGLSRTTGQVTHHIDADVDAERNTIVRDLEAAGRLSALYSVTGVGPTVNGRNGDGDRYFTDGELAVGVLAAEEMAGRATMERRANPAPIVIKNQFWSWLRPVLK